MNTQTWLSRSWLLLIVLCSWTVGKPQDPVDYVESTRIRRRQIYTNNPDYECDKVTRKIEVSCPDQYIPWCDEIIYVTTSSTQNPTSGLVTKYVCPPSIIYCKERICKSSEETSTTTQTSPISPIPPTPIFLPPPIFFPPPPPPPCWCAPMAPICPCPGPMPMMPPPMMPVMPPPMPIFPPFPPPFPPIFPPPNPPCTSPTTPATTTKHNQRRYPRKDLDQKPDLELVAELPELRLGSIGDPPSSSVIMPTTTYHYNQRRYPREDLEQEPDPELDNELPDLGLGSIGGMDIYLGSTKNREEREDDFRRAMSQGRMVPDDDFIS